MKDLIKDLKDKAKELYKLNLRNIDTYSSEYRKGSIFRLKLQDYFKGCTVEANYSGYRATIKLYLTNDYNIKDDVNGFFEKEEAFIDFLMQGKDLKQPEHYANQSMDYSFPGVFFEVYYQGGNCKRVKVRESIQVVPVYEVVCT